MSKLAGTVVRTQEWGSTDALGQFGVRALSAALDAYGDHPWFHRLKQATGDNHSMHNPRTLGMHLDERGLRVSHFIGAVELQIHSDSVPLVVEPRGALIGMDYAGMMATVLDAPPSVTGISQAALLFDCDVNGPTIESVKLPGLTLLEVTAFLSALTRFVQRGLRRGFSRVHENLTGRVRGRVLVSAQVRDNLVRARDDRMCCEYAVHDLDTLENRVLKAALDVSQRWLNRTGTPPQLVRWAATARAALAGVPEHRVRSRDWPRLRTRGSMQTYARPLALARLVLTRLHLDIQGQASESARTLPFYLDANRLFEAWVGVCLAAHGLKVKAQCTQGLKLPDARQFKFRPDFVVRDPVEEARGQLVVDAKYKPEGPKQSDLFQILGYVRVLAQHATDANCTNGEPGLSEACLALPASTPQGGTRESLAKFGLAWKEREQQALCWRDGFRLSLVRVPLPKTLAGGA